MNRAKGDETGRFCRILADWLDVTFTPQYITKDPHTKQDRIEEVHLHYDSRCETGTRICMTTALLENQTAHGQSPREVAIPAIFAPELTTLPLRVRSARGRVEAPPP
jgi:hypothetical protein